MKRKGKKLKRSKPSSIKHIPRGKGRVLSLIERPEPTRFKRGNQLWKKRGVGRKTTYSPEQLWEEFVAYTTWCDENPWYEHKAERNKEDDIIEYSIPHATPYSLDGFQVWCDMSDEFLRSLDSAKTADFSGVLSSIRKTVRTQQIDGAMTGFFNANIVARINSLQENMNVNGSIRTTVGNAFPTEEEMDKLNDERDAKGK